MFQGNEKKIIWDKKTTFQLSVTEALEAQGELLAEIGQNIVVIRVRGQVQTKSPLFGPQNYFDAKQGISYRIAFAAGSGFTAVYQHKHWWVRPSFTKNTEEIPERTQLLLFKEVDVYFAVLAVCGEDCRSDISGGIGGILVTTASNAGNRNRMDEISLVMAAGENPYLCIEEAVRKALAVLGRPAMLRENRRYPELFEGFGWCSWDAFYHKVSHEGIMQKMQELKEKNLPVKWALIDDGWLDADYESQVLLGLDAAAEPFPKGLKGCTDELKLTYGIEKVGVWHAVMGYWNGLKEDSEAANLLKEGCAQIPDGRILPAPEAGAAFNFYSIWHSYLKNACGIDFVKVDGQSAVSLAYGGMETYGKASREIQKGLNASAALYFDNQIINCMGMGSEDTWNRPSSAISRSSDDFVPEVPHGFREHAIQNGYNSLWQGQFFYGDWDMFWSSHVENQQNSILRAVSGGPVYVSDPVGKTSPEYILPLITKEGNILRCDGVGVPTLDCLLENPADTQFPLKLFNRHGNGFLMAAFHISNDGKECQGRISKKDIPGLKGKRWIVYAWNQKRVYDLAEADIPFALPQNGAELFLILPWEEQHTIFGMMEKYVPWAAVRILKKEPDFVMLQTTERGTFGFVSKQAPTRILADKKEVTAVRGANDYYTLTLEHEDQIVELFFSA